MSYIDNAESDNPFGNLLFYKGESTLTLAYANWQTTPIKLAYVEKKLFSLC